LISIEDQIKESGEGTSGQTELARSVLANNFTIQYPASNTEQQRIVAILDKAFAAIAAAKAHVNKQLLNSRKILEQSVENSLFEQGWEIKKLRELCSDVEYGSSAKSAEMGKVPVLRMGNIQEGAIDWNNLVYSNDEREINKYSLNYDDVLFNRTNSAELVGKSAVYKSEMPAIFAGYLIRVKRKESLLDADYLNYYLNSSFARSHGKTVMSSSVHQANINGSKLKNYPIPVPPIVEQQRLIKKLDALKEATQSLSHTYREKLTLLDGLRRSLLLRAFAGF
jgi:type I restriction enzyme S subunit